MTLASASSVAMATENTDASQPRPAQVEVIDGGALLGCGLPESRDRL